MSELGEQIDKGEIREKYDDLYPKFQQLGEKIKEIIEHGLKSERNKIDYFSVKFRLKEFDSFIKKIIKKKCFENPFEAINDILGVRVITYFKSDRVKVREFITNEFELIKPVDDKSMALSLEEFGYQAIHCDVKLNKTRQKLPECNEYKDSCAEIQICTINQHAWSEIFHKMDYKPKDPSLKLPSELKRRLGLLISKNTITVDSYEYR
ncbi:MAG: GTP pyrophosphokinase family protein [Promethearchaeota archaeon]